MRLIEIYHQIILIFGDSVLLDGIELGDEVIGVYGVDAKILECRYYEHFILYDIHEC